ncbi:hypothetical protein BaRGS_00030042, partial [Batillaria attramentaria]
HFRLCMGTRDIAITGAPEVRAAARETTPVTRGVTAVTREVTEQKRVDAETLMCLQGRQASSSGA